MRSSAESAVLDPMPTGSTRNSDAAYGVMLCAPVVKRTIRRPAVKCNCNRVGQIAGSNAGGGTRFPAIQKTGGGAVVPGIVKQLTLQRNSEKSPAR